MKEKVFMKQLLTLFLIVSILIIAGCTDNSEKTNGQSKNNDATINGKQKEKELVYASVGGKKITQEEIDYECFRAKLQQALTDAVPLKSCPSDEVIISQIIELRAIDYLAKDKGVSATPLEVQQRLDTLKKDLALSKTFREMVSSYGEEKFWKHEEQRYFTIINTEKIKESLMKEEKEKHSYYDEETLQLTAQQNLEDLIVEAVGLVETTIFYN